MQIQTKVLEVPHMTIDDLPVPTERNHLSQRGDSQSMGECTGEWLRYLESRMTNVQADLRARSTITVPAAVAFLAGSIIFIDAGGAVILGLIGIGVAVAVLAGAVIYNLKSFVFISRCDRIARKILLGQLSESTDINREFDEVINRCSSRSAISEGLEVLKRTRGK